MNNVYKILLWDIDLLSLWWTQTHYDPLSEWEMLQNHFQWEKNP